MSHIDRGGDTTCWCCPNCVGLRRIFARFFVDVSIWIIVGVPVLYLYKNSVPYRRGFFCDDDSLRYPYKENTISDDLLLLIGFALPFVVFMLNESERYRVTRKTDHVNKYLVVFLKISCAYAFGFTIIELIIQGAKPAIGRLRPHFFDVCKPDFSKIDCTKGYITDYNCTNANISDKLDRESRLSFPSGHAGFAMYSAIFTALYMEKQVTLRCSAVAKCFTQTAMVLLALMCAVTRLYDNRHHVSDIVAGCVLGAVIGFYMFKVLGEKALRSRTLHLKIPFLMRKQHHRKGEISTPTPLLSQTCSSSSTTEMNHYFIGRDGKESNLSNV
ncbi:PLPP1_2_3 [Mytilus edulis]|uniref:PLPP1_2_3 n=1 Tax=Mytilus edulis TaxID=6550 RepID=A0A8S3UBH2_MYTED|nr:PLPP1_2_3 [Mytilus edulis]